MELKKRRVHDLASAIAAAESLIEFKRESSKLRCKKTHYDSDRDRHWDKSPRQDKPTSLKEKGRDKKDKTPKKYSSFLCNGPHRFFKCSKHGKLAALVIEEERHKEETIVSISLLNAIQSKVREQANGRSM